MKKSASLGDLLTKIESTLLGRNSRQAQLLNEREEAKPLGRTLILVVEPDKEIEREYQRVFSDAGYDLKVVSCVTDAVKQLKNARFDCIIVDVDLPDMAGYNAVSVIKTIEQKANIIITAARNTKELEARIREEDIFYYYIKSFDREELKLAVQSALTRSEREVNAQ